MMHRNVPSRSSRFTLALLIVLLVTFTTAAFAADVPEQDSSSVMPFIVGGKTVLDPQKYPWMVSLNHNLAYPDIYRGHGCGGTLIAPGWVLTAAHCVTSFYPNFQVVTGTLSLQAEPGSYERIPVKRILRHPSFDPETMDNDLALLQLGRNSAQKPIPALARSVSFTPFRTLSTVAGWGALTQGGRGPVQLQEVDVPLVTNTVCQDALEEDGMLITENMICAGFWEGGKDSCQGDSGGPLMIEQNGQMSLLGVVSFGEGCALPKKPGVYARVPRFVEWITDTAQEECLFDALERLYPGTLAKMPGQAMSTTQEEPNIRYRSYPLIGAMIASFQDNDSLFYMGPSTDRKWTNWGPMDQWLKRTGCQIFD
jgi:secreted trypsin-like serine protease